MFSQSCVHGLCLCLNISPATAAALNPATPPLHTITWIWTQQWMWKKKVWRSLWNHFSPTGFIHLCVSFHSRRLLVQSWRRKSVFSPNLFCSCRNIQRQRGKTVWLLEGMWEACNVLYTAEIDFCQEIRALSRTPSTWLPEDWFSFHSGLTSEMLQLQTDRQRHKSLNGVGGRRVKSVNKSDRNSQHSHASSLSGPALYFLIVFCVCDWTFRQICFDSKLWRHGRASRRASGRAADRARPRGLADRAGGPLQCGDEPQQRGQTSGLSANEDEETTGLLLQAAGPPGPLQTSTTNHYYYHYC